MGIASPFQWNFEAVFSDSAPNYLGSKEMEDDNKNFNEFFAEEILKEN